MLKSATILQENPFYMKQLLEHPSPLTRLPSSHSSPLLIWLSPHAKTQVLFLIMYPVLQELHYATKTTLFLQEMQLESKTEVHA